MSADEEPLSNSGNSPTSPYRNFGMRVRVARESRGKGQQWLSERLRARGVPISKTALSRLESGDRAIKLAEAVVLCDLLDLDVNLRQFAGEADDLGLLAEAAALREKEAQEEVREAEARLSRAEARHTARAILRDASRDASREFEWRGTSSSLLRAAFGSDHGAARVALRALGVPEDALKDHPQGNIKLRGPIYERINVEDYLQNIHFTDED